MVLKVALVLDKDKYVHHQFIHHFVSLFERAPENWVPQNTMVYPNVLYQNRHKIKYPSFPDKPKYNFTGSYRLYVYVCIYICVHIYIYTYVHTYIYIYVCVCVPLHPHDDWFCIMGIQPTLPC